MNEQAKKAEDPKELESRFMDYRIPGGSERWWAVREIEKLRAALEERGRERDEAREEAARLARSFRHTYQAFCGGCGAVEDGEAPSCVKHPEGRGRDQCGACGLDLREAVHERS